MGQIADLGATWLRDYDAPGIPLGKKHEPEKVEGIALFAKIDQAIASNASQIVSGKGFATKSDMTAAVGSFQNGDLVYVLADTAGDVTNGNGQYLKVSGSWVWQRPLGATAADVVALRNLLPINETQDNGSVFETKPVYSRGMRSVAPAFLSTVCGWASTWDYDGTYQFDGIRIAFKVETVGKPVLVEVWNAAGTSRIAGAVVIPKLQEDMYEILLDRNVTTGQITASTKPYIRIFSADGATRLVPCIPTQYPADANDAGQLYEVQADIEPSLANWNPVMGGGDALWFELFSSLNRTRRIGGTAPNEEDVLLPPRIYGVKGEEVAIYFENLRVSRKPRRWRMSASNSALGILQDERWSFTPEATYSNQTLNFLSQDPDTLTTLGGGSMRIDVVDPNTGGGSKNVLVIGDSQTANGIPTARVLALAAQYSSGLAPTFIGSQGGGSNKFEAYSGATIAQFFSGTQVGSALAPNPFSNSGTFDVDYYLTNTAPGTPDVVCWMLGPNSFISQVTDPNANAMAATSIAQIDAMIGLTSPGGGVKGFKISSGAPNTKHLVFVNIPGAGQDGFGAAYAFAFDSERYRRSIYTWAKLLIDHYRSRESDGVFLVPMIGVVDPRFGFPKLLPMPASKAIERAYKANTFPTYAGMVADLTAAAGTRAYCTDTDTYHVKRGPTTKGFWSDADDREGVLMRQRDGLHPATSSTFDGVGYDEMGSQLYAALSCLKQIGSI